MSQRDPHFFSKIPFYINKAVEPWIIFALTTFLLGFFFFPSSSKHNTFFYIAVCAPLAFLLPSYFKQIRPKNPLIITTLIFIFYLYLNSNWSIHFTPQQSLKYLRYAGTLYCLFAAIYLVQYKKPTYSSLLFPAFIITGFFHSLYGIFEHFIHNPAPFSTRYNDPIDSSMQVGFLLLTCVWLYIESNDWRQKTGYVLVSLPFIAIILLSKSRGPQVALFLTVPIFAYFQNQHLRKFIFPIISLLALFSCLLLFTNFSQIIFDRGISAPFRQGIWLASLDESLNYFWFGQGASYRPPLITAKGSFNHSHSILLSIFRMGGIVAVLLFLSQLVLCFVSAIKNKSSSHRLWTVWLFFGIVCLMTNGKYPLTRPSSAWLAYWIPLAFICASYSQFISQKDNEKNT